MLIKAFNFIFEMIIGKVPEDKKRELRLTFRDLLREIFKAGVEGAVAGAINANKK